LEKEVIKNRVRVDIGSNPQEAADLKAMGFSVVQAPPVYHAVYCDSNDPASPFANKKVREAIE
jgi:hypothetical protein